SGWRLDVVTLLAVIGESSIAEHSQAITASMMCLLPRIIPAPQALLKGTRPLRMPETTAKMSGVHSGVHLDTVGFFANIIHPLDEFTPFAFKVLHITHKHKIEMDGAHDADDGWITRLSNMVKGSKAKANYERNGSKIPAPPPHDGEGRTTSVRFHSDVEAAEPQPGIHRRATMKERMTNIIANPTVITDQKRPAVPANLWSPVHILSVFSVLLTFGIIGAAGYWQDGTAILAVSLVALASSVVGAASWWCPILMHRRNTNQVPKGDVIIRTREGAFLLVICTEEVARELYAGTEECEYRIGARMYRALMGLGTFLLMVSVILLGNCTWNSQLFVGASYVVLNGLYWAMGLLPKRLFWDLSRYEWKEVTPDDAKDTESNAAEDPLENIKSFTRTLWFAIRETQRTSWVEKNGAAPSSPQWRAWLAEAEKAAKNNNRKWPAVARKNEIMRMSDAELETLKTFEVPLEKDPAEQVAPATEVQ
ncbi:uncharacterized protein BCR38DRAFT_315595, partial [Pseudomassariella vexata]